MAGDVAGRLATDRHGNLAFALVDGEELPLWACRLYRRAPCTLADHQLFLATEEGPPRAAGAGASCCSGGMVMGRSPSAGRRGGG